MWGGRSGARPSQRLTARPRAGGRAAWAHTDLEQPGQAEVGHLAGQGVAHEHVPSGQVPVHDPLFLQVAHALGHLAGEVQQDGQAQGPALGACGGSQQSGGWRLPGDIPLCRRSPTRETG